MHMNSQANALWSAGLWLERGLPRLPARTYKGEVLVVPPPPPRFLCCHAQTPTHKFTTRLQFRFYESLKL